MPGGKENVSNNSSWSGEQEDTVNAAQEEEGTYQETLHLIFCTSIKKKTQDIMAGFIKIVLLCALFLMN